MYTTQLSVFVENKHGDLSEILEILRENNINIRALSMADTADFGILRMIVDDTDLAKTRLREKGIIVKSSKVLALAMDDTPGGLASIVKKLKENGISIEYLYAFLGQENNHAQVVMRVDDREKAEEILA